MAESDVVAITQLINLYGLAVDSQRRDLFDRIFAADVDAIRLDPAHDVHPRRARRRGILSAVVK